MAFREKTHCAWSSPFSTLHALLFIVIDVPYDKFHLACSFVNTKLFLSFSERDILLSGRAHVQLGIIGFSSSVQSSQIRYATDSISNSRWDLNIRNNRINKQQLRARYIFIVIGVMTRKCLNWTFTATSLFLRDTYPNKWVECEFSLTDAIQCATLKLFNNDFRTIKRTLEP